MLDTPPPLPLSSSPPRPPLLLQERRIELALEHWRESDNTLSKTKIAHKYGILPRTFIGRTNGKQAKSKAHEHEQRSSPEEELALLDWVLRLQAWGWPPRVEQARLIANEITYHKQDYKPIRINWTQKFIKRHPITRTAYIPPLDKERAMAEDPAIFSA